MRLLFLLIALSFSHFSDAQGIPENAKANRFGSGWVCDRGFSKSGNECKKIVLPENAVLDYTGSSWQCSRGFSKAGNECKKVVLPENAVLDYTGGSWQCSRGFSKAGNECKKVVLPENAILDYTGSSWQCSRGFSKAGNECKRVVLPENAILDYTGSSWQCSRGFFKSGNECKGVVLPENAALDYAGNSWQCLKGYKRSGVSCVAMTPNEAKAQADAERKILQRIQRRENFVGRGGGCDTEYKTNAEVCVGVRSAEVECNKSAFGNYYNDCDVEIRYELRTNYSGGAYLDVDVSCEAEIEYSGRSTISTHSDSERKRRSHNLYANGSDAARMELDFSFSSLSEVTKVRLSSVKCKIESINLY